MRKKVTIWKRFREEQGEQVNLEVEEVSIERIWKKLENENHVPA